MSYREQILAIVSIVLAGAVPIIRQAILTKWTPSRLAQVSNIARGAVRAAEKLAALVPGTTGQAKLTFAVSVVEAGAKRLGVKLTDDEVLAAIHFALAEIDVVKQAASA